MRERFGIGAETKIILYMPTFRDDGSLDGYDLDFDGVIGAFARKFGGEFALLVRLHPNVQTDCIFQYNKGVYNATPYDDAQELLMAADCLITDYSSVVFDFALLKRPAFLCALDYEKYCSTRGLTTMFMECPFDRCFSNEELIKCINTFSLSEYATRLEKFMGDQIPYDRGDAAKRAVEWMLKQ